MLDFLIFYEVPVREFESIALLGRELTKRGYTVEYFGFEDLALTRYAFNRKRIRRYYNKVRTVLTPSLYHDKELYQLFYYVCGRAAHVVNLRWEQYFTNRNMADVNSYLFPHEDALLAHHLCWGRKSCESMRRAGMRDERLAVTGPMHMDLFRPELNGYYLSRSELLKAHGLPPEAQTLLYISSFVGATMTDRQFQDQIRDFDGAYQPDMDRVTYGRKSYALTLSWIGHLLDAHPEITFVYRPHPNENVTGVLLDMTKKYPNFHVITEHSVKQWILTCDKVLTWISTSIMEAFFAGKDCFIVRPIPQKPENDMCFYRNAECIGTEEQFLSVLSGDAASSFSREQVLEYYDVDADKPSYVRTADEVIRIAAEEPQFPWNDEKCRVFDRMRPRLFLHSLVLGVYFAFLRRLLAAQDKHPDRSFGPWLTPRMDNYRTMLNKKDQQKANAESFAQISERLDEVLG